MNRNSYVTAALFVVFVLLTVVYFNLPNGQDVGPTVGINGIENPILPVGDLVNQPAEEDDNEENETGTDTHEGQYQGNQGETEQGNNQGGGTANEGGNQGGGTANEGGNQGGTGSELGASALEEQTTSHLQALRTELAAIRSQRVSNLTGVIASVDNSPQEKSDALDQMNNLDVLQNSTRLLETTILAMGFNDVVVEVNDAAENVILHVEIDSLENQPSRETIAELTLLAGQQFGSRNRISVNFTAVN